MQFNDLPIADGTKDAVAAMGYEEATPIQEAAIPHMLDGRDVIGRAQTGTGKTAAFGIPLVNHLRDADDGIRGLVLCPTRELALQVTEVLTDLAKGSRIRVVPVYGGTGFNQQEIGLRQRCPLIVVACPGRLLDLMGRGKARLDDVEMLILDEADRMLDMGFIHDMRRVLAAVPTNRQTGLFSATISQDIKRLAGEFQRDPVTVEVDAPQATDLTEQWSVKVEKSHKKDTLLRILEQEVPGKAVVFTRTKHVAKRMARQLDTRGWSSVALQGNMTQNQRERAMAAFRDGRARILVATDVAARGLDVPDISHVINFDMPDGPDTYVHRIGRTGRNGATGTSITFVQSDEHNDLRDLRRVAKDLRNYTVQVDEHSKGPDKPVMPALVPQQPQKQGAGKPRGRSNGGGGRGPRRQGGGGHRGGGRRNHAGGQRTSQ